MLRNEASAAEELFFGDGVGGVEEGVYRRVGVGVFGFPFGFDVLCLLAEEFLFGQGDAEFVEFLFADFVGFGPGFAGLGKAGSLGTVELGEGFFVAALQWRR